MADSLIPTMTAEQMEAASPETLTAAMAKLSALRVTLKAEGEKIKKVLAHKLKTANLQAKLGKLKPAEVAHLKTLAAARDVAEAGVSADINVTANAAEVGAKAE